MAAPESTTPAVPGLNPSAGPGAGIEPGRPVAGAGSIVAEERARLRDYLRGYIVNLERIMDVVIVSVAALQSQNADIDCEIARVLRSYAGNKLCGEIESAGKLLKALERASRPPAE